MSSLIGKQLDVVTVPDFSGAAAPIFTARTLLLLGSWLEHAGPSMSWPFHIASIGEPPPSVKRLAKKAGARITVCEPLRLRDSGLTNKLRGLEVKLETDRLLLLDVDTVVLGDLTPVLDLGRCMALVAANQNQIDEDIWREIYEAVGVAMPDERMLCLRAQLKDKLPPKYTRRNELDPMVPYFNSGILLTPPDIGLRDAWWDTSVKLMDLSEEKRGRWETVRTNDQAGLAIAVAELRARGVPFKDLPWMFHGNYLLFWTGKLTVAEARIFHAMKLYRLGEKDAPFDPAKEMALFERYLKKGAFGDTLVGAGKRLLNWQSTPGSRETAKLCDALQALNEKYVLPEI